MTLPFNASGGRAAGATSPWNRPAASSSRERVNFGSPGPIEKVSATGVDLGRVNLGTGENHGLAYDPGADELLTAFSEYPVVGIGKGLPLQRQRRSAPARGRYLCAEPVRLRGVGRIRQRRGAQLRVQRRRRRAALNTANHTLYVADTYNNVVRAYRLINVPKLTTGGDRRPDPHLGHVPRARRSRRGRGGDDLQVRIRDRRKATSSEPCPAIRRRPRPPTDVSAELPAGTLTAQTLYHYRLVAGNANGDRPGARSDLRNPRRGRGHRRPNPRKTWAGSPRPSRAPTLGDGVDTDYYFEYGQTGRIRPENPRCRPRHRAPACSRSAPTWSGSTPTTPTTTGSSRTTASARPTGPIRPSTPKRQTRPAVEKTFASDVDQDSATLNAQIDPGEGLTVYRFEYGTTPSFGSRTLVAGPIDPESSYSHGQHRTGLAASWDHLLLPGRPDQLLRHRCRPDRVVHDAVGAGHRVDVRLGGDAHVGDSAVR